MACRPNKNGWRGLLKYRKSRMYRGGLVYRRPSADEELIDLYCCRNPFCTHRLRPVPVDSKPVKHCGIEAKHLNTMTRARWNKISEENHILIQKISARISAAKIRREREKAA